MNEASAEGGGVRQSTTRAGERWFCFAAGAVLVAFVLLRAPELDAGAGYDNPDENYYVSKSIRYGGGDFNPHTFHHPPLMSYLMFAGQLARYGWGRMTGSFANPSDFKVGYLVDGSSAFLCARVVVLACAVVTAVVVMRAARDLTRLLHGDAGSPRIAALLAAMGLAASPMHIQFSALATDDIAVALGFTLAAWAAVRLVVAPTPRAALAAGAAAGLATGLKYTGVVSVVPVALACLLCGDASARARFRLLATAAAACVVVFLATCPWAVIAPREFYPSAWLQLFEARSRATGYPGFFPRAAWNTGLGPLWTILAVAALGVFAWRAVRLRTETRGRAAAVILAATLTLPLLLAAKPAATAKAHYLLPVIPLCFVVAAAECAGLSWRGRRWPRHVALGGAALWLAWQCGDLPARMHTARLPRTEDEVAAWIRGNIADGARIITEPSFPWLVRIEDRETEASRASATARARMVPAYRLHPAWVRYVEPLQTIDELGTRADDWSAIARSGPAYVLVSSTHRDMFARLPAGEYPGQRWHESVARSLPLVHTQPNEGRRGPTFYVYEVR